MSSSTQAKSVFDMASLLERLDNDEELAFELLELFVDESPSLLQDIETSIALKDVEKFELSSHGFKGTCANVSALRMQDLAFRLEQMAKVGEFTGAPEIFKELQIEFDTFREYIAQLS